MDKLIMKPVDFEVKGLAAGHQSKLPLYHQVFLLLKSKINDGEYGPGDYLPSERDLSDIYKVSRITTMRALNELAACGLVVRETGRGTRVKFVGQGVVVHGAAPSDESGDWPEGAGGSIKGKVVKFGYEPVLAKEARILRIDPGDVVQHAVRVLFINGEAFAQLTTFVAAEIGKRWTAKELGARLLHQILSDLGYSIKQVDETVTATLADLTLSEQLGVSTGAPLIKIMRTTYCSDGMPLEHMVGLYRPDRYRYQVSLNRNIVPVHHRHS